MGLPSGLIDKSGVAALERLTELEHEPARALAAEYMHEADILLGRLPRQVARHYRREVEVRVIEALGGGRNASADTVANALDLIGPPGHYLPSEIAGQAARLAARSLNPRRVVEALRYGAMSGAGTATIVSVLGLLYVAAIFAVIAGAARLISPDAAGVYQLTNGAYVLGLGGNYPEARDVLGVLFVPLSWAVGAGLYTALTQLLPVFIRQRRRRR